MADGKASAAVLEIAPQQEIYRQAPQNIEAEQALLGAILVNNVALNHITDRLRPEHFAEEVHQRIFAAILRFHDKGQIANPVTIKHFFDQDAALAEVGGGEYLARLAASSVSVINVADYSELIYDLALKRELITIGEEVVNTAYDLSDGSDAMAQVETAEQALFNLASSGETQTGFRLFRYSAQEAITRAEAAFKRRGEVIGVTTGMSELNRLLGGMQNSDLLILAGRPSMGKTALATTIAYNAARQMQHEHEEAVKAGTATPADKPKSVGFFSLEMSAEQLATRILSARAAINSSAILRGDLTNEEFSKLVQSSNELADLPILIDDTPAITISALRTRSRRLKRVNNLGMLVVDYLQLLRPSHTNNQANRVQEVSEITQGLKAIAKELNIPVLALSQLSRQVEQREDKRPQLSDLRESGSIEQDADVVMFVFREEYYLERKKPDETDMAAMEIWQGKMERVHGVAETIVAKQRNGPIGTALLAFNPNFTQFTDLTDDRHLPERHE